MREATDPVITRGQEKAGGWWELSRRLYSVANEAGWRRIWEADETMNVIVWREGR